MPLRVFSKFEWHSTLFAFTEKQGVLFKQHHATLVESSVAVQLKSDQSLLQHVELTVNNLAIPHRPLDQPVVIAVAGDAEINA